MDKGGPYKYQFYRIVEAKLPKLVIHPCCTTCGLPGDVSKPVAITEEMCECDVCADKDLDFDDPKIRDHECVRQFSTFFCNRPIDPVTDKPITSCPSGPIKGWRAEVGQTIASCRYYPKHPVAINEEGNNVVHIEEDKVDESQLKTNAYGQFLAPGVAGQYCSPYCLMIGMFTYGRCAGCSKSLPRTKNYAAWSDRKKEWIFDRYTHCSPECRRKFPHAPLTADHLNCVLGILPVITPATPTSLSPVIIPDEMAYQGRCANQTCGSGRDLKGNRVRGRVPRIGDFCSPECRKVVREASRQKKVSSNLQNMGRKHQNFTSPMPR